MLEGDNVRDLISTLVRKHNLVFHAFLFKVDYLNINLIYNFQIRVVVILINCVMKKINNLRDKTTLSNHKMFYVTKINIIDI